MRIRGADTMEGLLEEMMNCVESMSQDVPNHKDLAGESQKEGSAKHRRCGRSSASLRVSNYLV